jgi:hypothetical protein
MIEFLSTVDSCDAENQDPSSFDLDLDAVSKLHQLRNQNTGEIIDLRDINCPNFA